MKQNKRVKFYQEKKWIMAWWFKKNYPLTEEKMYYQWNVWWMGDFDGISDIRFKNAYEWVQKIIKIPAEEIKKGRLSVADTRSVPKDIQRLAFQKGYYIKKCAVSRHPLNVSGYAIYKSKKSAHAILGKKFDLTIKEVKEFLDKQEDIKKNAKERIAE